MGIGQCVELGGPLRPRIMGEGSVFGKLSSLPTRLEDALDALEADHEFLTAGGVFPEHLIKNFIALKRKECLEMSKIPHPAEFDKYFNL